MIRAYRCAALDTPLAYIQKKLTPGPLGPKKGPYGRSAGRFPATGLDFGPKIRFLLYDPVCFCNGPFVALAKTVDLAPSDRFFDFSFPSYGRFREGDPPT